MVGLVAQWIRRLTTNQEIPGSSPGGVKYFCFNLSTTPNSHQLMVMNNFCSSSCYQMNLRNDSVYVVLCTLFSIRSSVYVLLCTLFCIRSSVYVVVENVYKTM